jgi:hypothetical protein
MCISLDYIVELIHVTVKCEVYHCHHRIHHIPLYPHKIQYIC